MTFAASEAHFDELTSGLPARPTPPGLEAARADVLAAARALATIPDAALTRPWAWTGGSEEELRYGAYRIAERFELAAIEAGDRLAASGVARGRAADLVAPLAAARWDLAGLLLPLPESAWDADPGDEAWTIRQTLGHVVSGQRAYGLGTAWWLRQGWRADDPDLPPQTPDELWADLPTDEAESEGHPADVLARLEVVSDRTTERLAGLSPEQLAIGGRWSGFPVDVAFRLGRWGSHVREHAIQVEKTLVMLDRRPTEIDRLVRHVAAAWGRAEAVVTGATDEGGALSAAGALTAGAADARATAEELAELARAG
jgi:hypothetical protein